MLVVTIYRGGGGERIGGGDRIRELVGELVHSQWKPHIEIEEDIISLTSIFCSLHLHFTVSPSLPHQSSMIFS